MKRIAFCLVAIFLMAVPFPILGAEIPGYSITSLPSQVVAEYIDNGNYLLLVQDDAEGDIYLLEISPDKELVSATRCPYDKDKEISYPTMKVWGGYVHLVYSAEGYGRYAKYNLATQQWGGLVRYNYSTTTSKIYESSIDIDEVSGIIYVAGIGRLSCFGPDKSVFGIKSADNGRTWCGWLDGWNWRQTLLISDDTLQVDQTQISIVYLDGVLPEQGTGVFGSWLDPRRNPEWSTYDLYWDAYYEEPDTLWGNIKNSAQQTWQSCQVNKVSLIEQLEVYAGEEGVVGGTEWYEIITTNASSFAQIDGYSTSQIVAVWETGGKVYYSISPYYNPKWKTPIFLASGTCPVVAAGEKIFVAYNSTSGITAEVMPWPTRGSNNCFE